MSSSSSTSPDRSRIRVSFVLDTAREPELAYFQALTGYGEVPRELLRLAVLGKQTDDHNRQLVERARELALNRATTTAMKENLVALGLVRSAQPSADTAPLTPSAAPVTQAPTQDLAPTSQSAPSAPEADPAPAKQPKQQTQSGPALTEASAPGAPAAAPAAAPTAPPKQAATQPGPRSKQSGQGKPDLGFLA